MRLVQCLRRMLSIVVAASVIAPAVRAQPAGDSGIVADDDLTFVVATRFVVSSGEQGSPVSLFRDARIPLASFNDTDRCLDEQALLAAQEYFTALGRALGKAGYFYFVPDDAVEAALAACEKKHGRSPAAFASGKTKILAFGKVVPTGEAAALEDSLR